MATATKRTIERVKTVVSEANYAQRRLFELRTGVPVTSADEPVRPATSAEELDALYELEHDEREQRGKLAA